MGRSRRSPARFLAPIFLIAVIVAAVMVVQATRPGKGSDSVTSTTQGDAQTSTTAGKKSGAKKAASKRSTGKTYTVKSGDNLSTVAEKTGVSVAKLEALNPKLDAQNLQVGQKLKLSGSAGSTTTP